MNIKNMTYTIINYYRYVISVSAIKSEIQNT